MALAPVLLALALAATPSPDAPPEEVRAQVIAYLGAIHRPVPPEAFRALGPGAEDVLADVARTDPSPLRRVRALDALAGLGGVRAEQVHREVLASPASREVRRGAVRGLGRLLGAGAPATLGPVLERDRDPAVRAAAAEALARAAPTEGCARVRARARVDPEAARFRRALEDCAGHSPR
jgi:hypothetical protein